MITLAMRTEYSFGKCYYPLSKAIRDSKENGYIGVADLDNTFAHSKLRKECKDTDIKPIYGVRLRATEPSTKNRSYRKTYDTIVEFVFLAKNDKGLKEIYKLVNDAFNQFYYFPRLTYYQIADVSDNVFVFCEKLPREMGAVEKQIVTERIDYFIQNDQNLDGEIAIPFVNYPAGDKDAYEIISGGRGDLKTYNTGQANTDELLFRGYSTNAIFLTHKIAAECNAEVSISEFVKYPFVKTMEEECKAGAERRGIDLDDPVYRERLEFEISVIMERGFQDYFLIVADILMWAKEAMLVGPGRGSSGGSLVCYLMGITEMDPIKYDLLFARFVDLNRVGLPDIDSDIPDIHRKKVIRYMTKLYGEDNVKTIGTITTYKPKSAISDVAKALEIPSHEVQALKDSIIERQGGDDRAEMRIADTFDDTEIGRDTLAEFPNLRVAEKIEGHAKNQGKHAAGIIICNDPLYDYGGVNSKESTLMISGKEVEDHGLLKIDVLGLRTLSIIEETAALAGFDYNDFYSLELTDQKVFDVFNSGRLDGIFQFEGPATRGLTRRITVDNFDDVCSLCALSRPGALVSGEAARFVRRKNGDEEPEYFGDIHKSITEVTYGSVVYQEQGMALMREYAGLAWTTVNPLRKAISKSLGQEFFEQYKREFSEGALKNGHNAAETNKIWDILASMGSYSFNKSHAVAYSIISYWTAWCKAYYPLEFAAANLNHAKDNDSAVKILRDFVVNDDIEYESVDPSRSGVKWTISDGKLLGGLTNIDGVGEAKAKSIIKIRREKGGFTPGIAKKIAEPITPFDILFPAHHYFEDFYERPRSVGLNKKVSNISDIEDKGTYTVIGKVKLKDLVDRNSPQLVRSRGKTVDKDLYFLKLIIEDDTSDIMSNIPPFRMDELDGRSLSETLVEGKSWVLIRGSVPDDFRSISITSIQEIYLDDDYTEE